MPEGRDDPQQNVQPWLLSALELVRAQTHRTALHYVPEITLRLGTESVALWTRIERDLGWRGGPPYWAFAWAGGQALARHILDHPALVAGRRVLDLAAGSGLAAIAAAKAGAAQVTASDIDPLAVVAISLNAEDNGVAVTAGATDLLSGKDELPPHEVVLVGDLFYESEMSARTLAFLQRRHAAGCRVLIGDPGRTHLPAGQLTKVSEHIVPVARGHQYAAAESGNANDRESRRAAVWTLDQA